MYPQQPQQAVDPYTVNQWAINSNLPNAVPFIPPVNVNPQLQPYLQLITGHALLAAQNEAGRNPLRTYFFNMLTQNNFQNGTFVELVQATAELTEFLMNSQRKDINTAASEASVTMCSVQAAVLQESIPQLKAILSPEIINASLQWIQHFTGVAQQIMQWRQPHAMHAGIVQPQQGHYHQQPMHGGNIAPPSSAFNNQFWNTSSPPAFGSADPSFMGGLGAKPTTTQPAYTEELTSVTMLADRPKPIYERTTRVTSFGNNNQQPVVNQPDNNVAPVVEVNARPFDGQRTTEKGYIVIPASQSTWTVTQRDHKPYRLAYNPSTYCLFHGMSPEDGGVEEILVAWSDSEPMSYLKNELRSDMRAAIPEDPHAPRVVPNYDLLTHMSPVTDNLMGYDPKIAEAADKDVSPTTMADPVIITDISYFSGLGEMITNGSLERELIKDEGEGEIAQAAEQYGDVTRAVMCGYEDIAWFLMACRIKSIKELGDHINAARDRVSDKILDVVAQRTTDELNRGLKYNLQLDGLFVDDAFADYDDLMVAIEQRGADTLVQIVQSHEAEIISRSMHVLTGERLVKFITELHGEAAVEKLSRKILVFADRVGITYVDWSSEDMDLAFVHSGALSQATMPNLYRGVKAIYARVSASDLPFAHHLLRTSDGVLLEFHEGWLGRGFFLISRMDL